MSVLDSIVSGVLIDQKNREISEAELHDKIKSAPAVRDPLVSLRQNKFSVIAEVKRSSPSKGALAPIAQPETLAKRYEDAGASVVSVLTEERRFSGSLKDFDQVREAISAPMLRKDFMVNDYLIRESRAHGADLILLIVAALSDSQLAELYQVAQNLGMRCLVEVHDEQELERTIAINPEIIGINARNLHSLEVDLGAFDNLIPKIPHHIYKVAESGIFSIDDAKRAQSAGADAILVGEALVRAEDPRSMIERFMEIS